MLVELMPKDYNKLGTLFDGFDYSLSIRAVIEGNNPGRIYVDNADQPRVGFALTVEGYLLAGKSGHASLNQALGKFLRERIFSGEIYVNGDISMSLAVYPQVWEAKLPELIPTHEIEQLDRCHYLCHELSLDWRKNIPDGYSVRKIEEYPLKKPDYELSEDMRAWFDVQEMWGSTENFLSKGVSFCVLHGSQVVAWCTPDCTAGNRIDVGIFTEPEYRRKGLGTLAVAATVEHCLRHSFSAVGWHCNVDNIPSRKIAEKVGFMLNRKYVYYYYMYDPVDHWAELGWFYFKKGDYQKTAHYYEQVFAAREDNPNYYYHLAAMAWAALENQEMSLSYLNAAVDRGWVHHAWSMQQKELTILHDLPEWEAVLRRMQRLADQDREI